MKLPAVVLLLAGVALADQVSYTGFQVHSVVPDTQEQVEALRNLRYIPHTYNFWTDPSYPGRTVNIMVPPDRTRDFHSFLGLNKLTSNVTVTNVQDLIDSERPKGKLRPRAPEDFNWLDYFPLEDIYEWLRWLPNQHPNIVTVIVGGTTYEEREIVGVKVSYGPGRRGVFIESGIHAREWIAPATVTWVLNQLLTSTDPAVRNLAESYDWYFFPSVNPDGYAYSWSNDRMWRKTRKPYGSEFGADPNRNWDYFWLDGGADAVPYSDSFAGGGPFSEIETDSLSSYIAGIADDLVAYLAFHSSGQLILMPFGHNGNEKPTNQDQMLRIANAVARTIYTNSNTRYMTGNIPDTIYTAAGGSIDWVLGYYRHIKVVFAFELRPIGSFILDPLQIIPCAEDILLGLVTMFNELESDA